jgi:DMSO/TMAO reductase YedYZ molybdopterin-dependent catalytic subunit
MSDANIPQHGRILTRRAALIGGLAGGGGLLLSGCDSASPLVRSAEQLSKTAQRAIGGRGALAREFDLADRSPIFRVNGNAQPRSDAWARHAANGFADWRLKVDGLVERPLELSLSDLAAMPSRTQVTRHDCVEGWSAIGQWTGTPLGLILRRAGLKPQARYALFHCADDFGGLPYYESIDLFDAFHPQTILAWGMNGGRLPVGHGAPLRLRVERQLGYKQAKFVMRVEMRDTLSGAYGGKGGYWEDRIGYEWYAGI